MPRIRNGIDFRRHKFIDAYFRLGNATAAAREAGYKYPNQDGPRLARIPVIAQAIEAKIGLRREVFACRAVQELLDSCEAARKNAESMISSGDDKRTQAIAEWGKSAERLARMAGVITNLNVHIDKSQHATIDKLQIVRKIVDAVAPSDNPPLPASGDFTSADGGNTPAP